MRSGKPRVGNTKEQNVVLNVNWCTYLLKLRVEKCPMDLINKTCGAP